jgi:mono/diheme cytochrome c family protein
LPHSVPLTILRVAGLCIASWTLSAGPAKTLGAQKSDDSAATSAAAPSGAELFAKHCAACHGTDSKGAGPFPPPYRKPPDLTTLTRRHQGKFPAAYVSKVLRSGVTLPAHGPAEMPVWGSEFQAREKVSKEEVSLRIKALQEYLKSLQVK